MGILASCPACSREINAADRYAGVVVKCPGCGGNVRVPADGPRVGDAPTVPVAPQARHVTEVVVTDIQIPFFRLFGLAMLFAIAAALASFVLGMIGLFIAGSMGVFLESLPR